MRNGMALGAVIAVAFAQPALAHAPLMDCYENGDNTVTCEAGYSDGSSSAGQIIRVRDQDNRLLLEAHFGDDGTYTFTKPETAEYQVQFEGDVAHDVVLYSLDIPAAD